MTDNNESMIDEVVDFVQDNGDTRVHEMYKRFDMGILELNDVAEREEITVEEVGADGDYKYSVFKYEE